MLGLLLWHAASGDRRALRAARRIGDRLCDLYHGERRPRLVETGSTEMNLAPAHGLCLLYRETRDPRHLALARQWVAEFAARAPDGTCLAGDYLEGPLAGREFFELPRPRWESLHPIQALAELADLDADARCGEAFRRIWASIARHDRHNNGGFSSGERATGNPFDPAPIETCCTIAWSALSVDMLHATADPRVADELELTLFNSVLGMHSPCGRWATYNTPMDGVRRAAAHDIVFQAREGTPELNCCSVNSPRGFGLLAEWAVLRDGDRLLINAYVPGTLRLPLPTGGTLALRQETNYPWDGRIRLHVAPSRPVAQTLALRIPRWSAHPSVRVNGAPVSSGVEPGTYLELTRAWRKGDTIELLLDLTPHVWHGARECAGRFSVYRGPILLAWDRRYNETAPEDVPALDPAHLDLRAAAPWAPWLPPALLLEATAADGQTVRLCDFASAGNGGSPYRSWLPAAAGSGAPGPRQYFAPTADDLLRASLGRYRDRWLTCQAQARGVDNGWPRPDAVVGSLRALAAELPDLHVDAERARGRIAAAPESERAGALRTALQALAADGCLAPDFAARLRRQEIALRRQWGLPDMITRFACSALKPAPADIAAVPLPAGGEAFRPVTTVSEESFVDVRTFHGGSDGLLYLRAEHVADDAAPGRLLYGADGPVKVWVNGAEVGCERGGTNPAKAGQFTAAVHWRAGQNEILVALATRAGRAWGVFAGIAPG
jgi:hypothetical protein